MQKESFTSIPTVIFEKYFHVWFRDLLFNNIFTINALTHRQVLVIINITNRRSKLFLIFC